MECTYKILENSLLTVLQWDILRYLVCLHRIMVALEWFGSESQLSSQSEPKKNPRLICHCMSQNWMLMVSCEQPLSPPRHPQNLTLQLPTFKGWPPKAKHLATSFPAPMAYQHASEEHLTSHKRCMSQRRCLELYLGDLGGKARVRHFQVPNRIPYVPWLWSLLLCVCFVRWIFQ